MKVSVDMATKDHRHIIQCPGSNHRLGPFAGFLGGLKNQADIGWQRVLLHQQAGSAQKHTAVAVVTTGVHHANALGCKGQPRFFLDRKRVHIRTQRDKSLTWLQNRLGFPR